MVTDHKGTKWSNKQLLEKVDMQILQMTKLQSQVDKLNSEVSELKGAHLAAEKELLEKEELVERLQVRNEELRQLNQPIEGLGGEKNDSDKGTEV